MTKVENKKQLKIVKKSILIGCLCLFCVWIGFSLCACVTANVLNDAMDNAGDNVNSATTLFDEMQQHPENVSTVQLPFVVGDTESGDNTAGD